MKNKIKYSKGEIGAVEVVKDFLPLPKDLVPNMWGHYEQ